MREGQSEFRERLVGEHYLTFQGHRIFCHATLKGFWRTDSFLPQKVTAHHIHGYAANKHEAWVHDISNGILLAPPFHDLLHETQSRTPYKSIQEVSRAMIGDSFDRNWRKAGSIWLPDGSNMADVWEAHLASKDLIAVQQEAYMAPERIEA